MICDAGAPAIMSLLLLPAQIPLTTVNASTMVTPTQALASHPRLLRSSAMLVLPVKRPSLINVSVHARVPNRQLRLRKEDRPGTVLFRFGRQTVWTAA